jgi:uncharacterized protein YndB with AHSA1/START domain
MFRFYLFRRQKDPAWPARVWSTLTGGQPIPHWLMSYDASVESLRAKCAQKMALVDRGLSA